MLNILPVSSFKDMIGYTAKVFAMMLKISCPNCNQPVAPNARYCPNCGVDLALAAALAERDVVAHTVVPPDLASLAPEALVPRVGETMLERGILTPEQLQQALDYQHQLQLQGRPRLLGQTLIDLGMVDRETLDQVITLQIFQLQKALQDSNRELEQRVTERTMQWSQAVERLTELNRLKANFISTVSHELRTPLTHLKGYLELMAAGELGPLTNEQESAIAVMARAELRLERLIDDLIQFSLVSRGELSLNLSLVRLDDLGRAAVLQLEPKARAKNIAVQTEIPAPLPGVNIDEEKIGWVFTQLLDNAIKFTPRGGLVLLSLTAVDDLVTTTVRDTGIGIPAERIAEIFQAFHQLDSSSTRQHGGTGLGLALARRIIQAHGSEIEVKSKEGQGASFSFTLPGARQAADQQPELALRGMDESN